METESSMNAYDRMAELIANKWFDGKLPDQPTIMAIVVKLVLRRIRDAELPPEAPAMVIEAAKKGFADCLERALADRIRAQNVAKSEFQN